MKKKIIILMMLAVFLGISNVSAAESYTVKREPYGISNSDYCSFPIIDDAEKCDNKTYTGYRVGNGETFKINYKGETLSGYCIDPGVDAPKNVIEQSTSEISKYIEGFKHICEQTEGNEVLRGVLLKAYSVNPDDTGSSLANIGGKDPVGTKDAYIKLLEGGTKINEKYDTDPKNKGVNILKSAREKTNSKATTTFDPSFEKENGQLKLIATVPGTIKIANAEKYDITIYGAEKKENGIYKVLSKGEYLLHITNKNCTENITESVSVSFEYEKDDLGTSSSNYNVRFFANEKNNLQRLITCEKLEDGENPNCVGNECKINSSIEVSCEGEKCEDPVVKQGQYLCGDNGDTIISVTESPNKLEYIGDNCFTKLPDATLTILGQTNDYCEIRCSENYKLELPGPDATVGSGDKEVKINAGSYFTIDTKDKMYSESTFTCYGKMDYSKYQNAISTLKGNIAKKYNKLAEIATKYTIIKYMDADENGMCALPDKNYEIYKVDGSGKFIKDSTGGKISAQKIACEQSDKDKLAKEVTNATNELLATVEDSNKKIEIQNELWNDCLNWDISELNKLFEKENCSTNIEFDYSSESICDMKVVVDEAGKIKGQDVKEYKSTANKEKIYNSTCNINEDLDKCNTAGTTETYNYINQQATVKTTYKFDNDFTVEYATGKVSCEAKTGDGYSNVINGFPVSINTPQGIHEYKYTYKNIGHNFDSATTCAGRFDKYIDDKENNHNCKYDVNNCDDCEVYCDPEGVCNQDVCDGECQVACVGAGCIRDVNAGFLATYKTVSLNETFNVAMLSNHDGVNFIALADNNKNYSSNESFSGTNWNNEKGTATKANIANLGETIYNAEPEYSITLTPSVISNIKKYNAEQEDSDASDAKGYLNNTLKCTNVNGTNYGQCLSTFIHNSDNKWNFNILDKKTSSDQVIVEIDGNKAVFKSYLEIPKAFEGPAWK